MKEKPSADYLDKNWSQFLSQTPDDLTKYLLKNSNLPGPRGNLTLAMKLASLISGSWGENGVFLKTCFEQWNASDDEYLLFCLYTSLGYISAEFPEEDGWILGNLLEGNYSKHWRARESVTFALTRMLEKRTEFTLKLLEEWNRDVEVMVLRNTLMALANPKHQNQYRKNYENTYTPP